MKKEIVKSIINIVLSSITAILAVFGLAGCSGLDIQCKGEYCVSFKK